MKGLIKILFAGALLLGVTSVMASDHIQKVEVSKTYLVIQPAVVDHQEIVVERFDNEVLVIRHENDALLKITKLVTPVARPPNTDSKHTLTRIRLPT